ncbi:hypothetical protein KKA14_00590 [bacterium]|nr:hypothetical protein [bacterium]
MKSRHLFSFIWCMIIIIYAPFLSADTNKNLEGPEILTSDLTRKQQLESPELEANFVIYDDDKIVEVKINGKAQKFEPANTIAIDQVFTFQKGENLITVTATDEQGNQNTRSYLVVFGEELVDDALASEEDQKEKKLAWKIMGSIQLKNDSNPNNDIGLPIDTGDMTISGQIDDDKQADTQTAADIMAILMYGKWQAYVGYVQSSYSQSLYEDLAATIFIAGASYMPKASQDGLNAKFTLLNINMGGDPFALYNIFNIGYQFGRKDEGGTTRHLWAFMYNYKTFSDSALDVGNSTILQWEYTNMDVDNLDFFKSLITFGTGNDGDEESKFSIMTMDHDWANKWRSGFLMGIGYGLQYKQFPNQKPLTTELGSTRIDLPIRFSFDLGWEFNPDWALKYQYEYTLNISLKIPYYKTVNGLQLRGSF